MVYAFMAVLWIVDYNNNSNEKYARYREKQKDTIREGVGVGERTTQEVKN